MHYILLPLFPKNVKIALSGRAEINYRRYDVMVIQLYENIQNGGNTMRRVVVDMQNALFADAISTALQNFDSDFCVYQSDKTEKTTELCSYVQADVLIMEVTAYTPLKYEERMKICDEVKNRNPNCKVVLVVDENTEYKLADMVRQAKKDGLIDNFIYGSVSATYLSAVIDAL